MLIEKGQLIGQAYEQHLQVEVKQMARKGLIPAEDSLKQRQAQRRRYHHKKVRVLADEEVGPAPKRKVNAKKLQTLAVKHVVNLRQDVRFQQLSLQVPLQDLQGQEGSRAQQPAQPEQQLHLHGRTI